MNKCWSLILAIAVIVSIAAIVRFMPPKTIVIERNPIRVYDTVRIIETPDKRYFRARNIELNRADTAALKSIYGIGSIFAARIVDYRMRLGGYHRKEQLKEVKGISEEVYSKISINMWIDTIAIQKISINFATRKQLEKHPYFTPSMAERVQKAVEMKGGYTTLRQLLNDNILLPQEAQKIAPYLSFTQQTHK